MAQVYGGGESNGCEALSNDTCSTNDNDKTCFDATATEPAKCVKPNGRQYTGNVTFACATPPNTKEKTYEDVDCYRTNAFEPGLGNFGFACADPNCTPAAPQQACGQCKFADSIAAYVPVDTCVCIDP
jgi:hypothetical protein